ncbi:hypothetical protein HDU86_001048 [Geranomyces michiganensis]|nr:hypothetical protein HDU86_001048 [Geranomyces michiganensis]
MDVVIHVYDESKNAKRDFYCQRTLLLRQMTYFTSYLHAHSLDTTVEIDVHCDIEVFEWLMSYISRKRPFFEPRIALSILISSNFLQMTALEDLCIRYIHENLDDVLKIPVDMGCLSEPLIQKLTKLFTIEELQRVKDPQDKVLNALFFGKLLDQLGALAAQKNAVCACRLCGKLYALAEEPNLMCSSAPVRISLSGELLSPHERDAAFDINEFVAMSHSRGICWKDLYWLMWGILNHLSCTVCNQIFACRDFITCVQHPADATFAPGEAVVGHHACCGTTSQRFDAFRPPSGCCQVPHIPPADTANATHATYLANADDILRHPGAAVRYPPHLPLADNRQSQHDAPLAPAVESDSARRRISAKESDFVDLYGTRRRMDALPVSWSATHAVAHGKGRYAQRTEDVDRMQAIARSVRMARAAAVQRDSEVINNILTGQKPKNPVLTHI